MDETSNPADIKSLHDTIIKLIEIVNRLIDEVRDLRLEKEKVLDRGEAIPRRRPQGLEKPGIDELRTRKEEPSQYLQGDPVISKGAQQVAKREKKGFFQHMLEMWYDTNESPHR